MISKNFAILGQRKLRTHAEIVHARDHNNRDELVGNAVQNAPAPVVVLGPQDAWQGVRDRLQELDIRPRKGAVLALELMMSASPGWFIKDSDDEWSQIQLSAYERVALRYVRARFVPEAIISATWHLDEQTPHLHVIVLPVRQRVDQRFGDRRERWSLCARGDLIPKMEKERRAAWYASAWRGGIGGRGHMAHEQTVFAETMACLKLERGKVWSGEPNKPNAVHQAEMRDAIAAAGIEREGLSRQRSAVAAEADRQREEAIELKRLREELDAERAAWASSIDGREEALRAERAVLDERSQAATAWKAKFEKHRDALRVADVNIRAREARAIAAEERTLDRAAALADLTRTAARALATVDPETLPAAARAEFFEAARALNVSVKRAAKTSAAIAGVAASRRTWRGFAGEA